VFDDILEFTEARNIELQIASMNSLEEWRRLTKEKWREDADLYRDAFAARVQDLLERLH
jgi:hypothetical protein